MATAKMTTLLEVIFALAGFCVLVLGLVLFIQSVAALARTKPRPLVTPDSEATPSFVVLVPAHDEGPGIGDTVTALKAGLADRPPERARIVVVADNCSDDTAARAEAAGAEVLVRTDPEKRGRASRSPTASIISRRTLPRS